MTPPPTPRPGIIKTASLQDRHEQLSRLLRQIHAYLRFFDRLAETGQVGYISLLRRPNPLKVAVPERWPGDGETAPDQKDHAYGEAIHMMKGVVDELQDAQAAIGAMKAWTPAYVRMVKARYAVPGYVWTGEQSLRQILDDVLEPSRECLARYGLAPRVETRETTVDDAPEIDEPTGPAPRF